ncbi:MAG: outer membrane lipoprotein-sorting protein [Spirochaetales bacterium]|jgi:outer membrane lipoprotein-sorting protein|nr:outer membrane lipoprotein-sorting protein [Spirochaetales bacterium]
MKKYSLSLLLLILLVPALQAETGAEIMRKVIDGQKADSSAMDIRMILSDREGNSSSRRIQTLVTDDNGLTKTITLFLEPASVKNTRFLTMQNETRNDDQWIYLPALRKIKRIASAEKGGSFMGSDFSYSDMSYSDASVDESEHTLLREEMYNGYDCFVVESIPDSQTDSSYGKEISWVDKQTWLAARVEFYGKNRTEMIKVLTSEDFKQVQNHWLAGRITMSTVETGHQTTLEFQQVKFDIPINPAYFTTGFLETGRTR